MPFCCVCVENETEDVKDAKEIEIEGVRLAEKGNIDLSLEMFTKAIQLAPNRASGYNNRAQSWQLKGNIPGVSYKKEMCKPSYLYEIFK